MVETVNSSTAKRAKQGRQPPREWTAVNANCFEEGGRSSGAEASPGQDWGRGRCGAAGTGREGVKLRARVRGGGSKASWAAGERGLGAQLNRSERLGREPPAQVLWGSGCA